MVPQLGAPLGLIVASALFAYFAMNLSAADFLSWGWRYPFFCAFAINVVALFARLRGSEEHTSELQSLMRISYAVFCLKKKKVATSDGQQDMLAQIDKQHTSDK